MKYAELMLAPVPQNPIEEHFVDAANSMLSTTALETGRNESGILYYRWFSPSPAIHALSVYVKESEVMLSTKISHTHVNSSDFGEEHLTKEDMSRRVAQEGVAKAAAIMRGEIAFTETFDGRGNKVSSGLCRTDKLAEGLSYTRQVFGDEMTKRAFTWFGEIAVPE